MCNLYNWFISCFKNHNDITICVFIHHKQDDIKRWFLCHKVHKEDCEDQGLTFPTTCTFPPCNTCKPHHDLITTVVEFSEEKTQSELEDLSMVHCSEIKKANPDQDEQKHHWR